MLAIGLKAICFFAFCDFANTRNQVVCQACGTHPAPKTSLQRVRGISKKPSRKYCFEIPYSDLLLTFLIRTLYRYPYTQIVHSSFHGEPIKEILRAIFLKKKTPRELAKSNVTSLLPQAMFTEHNVFTTSVALVLLVCNH